MSINQVIGTIDADRLLAALKAANDVLTEQRCKLAARDALIRSYRADHSLTMDKDHTCPCVLCQEAGTLLGDAS